MPAAAGCAKEHFVYVLWNEAARRTYAGYTVDPVRRLRQHNGELAGGARATSKALGRGPWGLALVVHGLASKHDALSLEWRLKHPPKGAPTLPVPRRVAALAAAAVHPRFEAAALSVDAAPWVFPSAAAALAHLAPRVSVTQRIFGQVHADADEGHDDARTTQAGQSPPAEAPADGEAPGALRA